LLGVCVGVVAVGHCWIVRTRGGRLSWGGCRIGEIGAGEGVGGFARSAASASIGIRARAAR
jgi:hypothetical protein